MNQTRTFLILAWLMVAFLLWSEWNKERLVPPAASGQAPAAIQAPAISAPAVGRPASAVPTMGPAAVNPGAQAFTAPQATPGLVTVTTDVLRLQLDGTSVRRAELLAYPQERGVNNQPVALLSEDPARFATVRSGWIGDNGGELAFVPEQAPTESSLAPGQDALELKYVARGPDGLRVHRTWRVKRGSYAIAVEDTVVNAGGTPWQGTVYRQAARVPPTGKSGFTNPESFTLSGAAWYSPEDKYDKRKFADFIDDGPLDKQVTGGWVALSQHYFLVAWVPQKDQPALFALSSNGPVHAIEARGPRFAVAPGQQLSSNASLWLGPKLAEQLDATAPGLGLAMDYGIFTVLSKPIHWTLTQLHKITGNWGWAIVLLVVVIKLLLYPLSAAQYKSMAKMRKFQPRIEQLKERYGEDKQKFQMAMLELYKKEKINPAGGCLPILIQMPVFLALYYVLLEAVELRQAIWIPGWVDDLTARDPFFVLPVLNGAIMWLTQKLSPTPGMDPMQKKMLQMMPVVMAVMFAFFPAGLVLYWVTNGALGLLQQWWMTRLYAEAPEKPAKA